MIRYAAYGSNLHPVRLCERIPAARMLGTACTPGWSLHFHKRGDDGSAKCAIGQPGDGVYVAVYELDAADKQTLDVIEGVGAGYETTTIDVPGFGQCHTYLSAATHVCSNLAPYDWYRELVLLGCRKLAFPAQYVDGVAQIAVAHDPDDARRRQHWQLVERLRADPTT